MSKTFATLLLLSLCVALFPAALLGQKSDKGSDPAAEQAIEQPGEISNPVHHDRSRPLREMFETKERPGPARGGRDFEPGRPMPVGNTNPYVIDPLVENSVSAPSALALPKASTGGTGVDPSFAVAPPDTTGDVGPNHYVQWVNLRYAIYTLTRDAQNQITGYNLVAGFPKNGNVVWNGFGGTCQNNNDGDPIVQYDQLADRWILTQFAVSSAPFTQCVAVSDSPDPTGNYFR